MIDSKEVCFSRSELFSEFYSAVSQPNLNTQTQKELNSCDQSIDNTPDRWAPSQKIVFRNEWEVSLVNFIF